MLSFPRLRRGKDNRQLYSIPDITSFILVYQRDDHINNYTLHIPAKDGDTILKGKCGASLFQSQFGCVLFPRRRRGNNTKEQPFCIISNTYQNWELFHRKNDFDKQFT